ncbi:MAG: sigma-54 dependent transcriptional regulator [Candidatus Erginobacter occultus]|nr:sigma-54 dependent transcriptional regulator [Candidatus Erginobacter occultus]
MDKLLIIEDERIAAESLAQFLGRKNYATECAYTLTEAVGIAAGAGHDVYLVDVRLPDGNGLELIPRLRRDHPDSTIIVLTAYGTVEDAVAALKSGADHYLIKPVNLDELLLVLQRERERRSLRAENRDLKSYVSSISQFDNLIGDSPAMVPVFALIRKLCASDAAVLLTGESGTGKNQVARTLQYSGLRREKPFITVHCATIPAALLESELFGHIKGAFTGAVHDRSGRFESADGGTIFLDEVGELPPDLQAKLLRVLQEQTFERVGSNRLVQVDVRIIASTNRDLKEMVTEGKFREDLFWRLNVVEIALPPLRERGGDIVFLARHFVKMAAEKLGRPVPAIEKPVLNILQSYLWPGNIRELENVIERAMALIEGAEITVDLLPPRLIGWKSYPAPSPIGSDSLQHKVKEFERSLIEGVLRQEGGNRAQAAKRLGISLRTLQYRLKDFKIS